MHVATGGANVKWGAPISNGGPSTTGPSAGDGPVRKMWNAIRYNSTNIRTRHVVVKIVMCAFQNGNGEDFSRNRTTTERRSEEVKLTISCIKNILSFYFKYNSLVGKPSITVDESTKFLKIPFRKHRRILPFESFFCKNLSFFYSIKIHQRQLRKKGDARLHCVTDKPD